MITEDYVSFETAKLLKEKGFDEECQQYYGDYKYPCPTLQLVMKWLREVHSYNIEIDTLGMMELNNLSWRSAVIYLVNENECYCEHGFDSYEEACEAAIRYTLENLI